MDIMCFDKTGTLTEEFPETFAYGVNSVVNPKNLCLAYNMMIYPEMYKKVILRGAILCSFNL